jgi:hypothetical protein
MRRSFNQRERIALNWAAAERCLLCGKPLGPDWEPDHIIPHARGGQTDVLNGQAVCRACNRKKGASMLTWLEKFFHATWGQMPRNVQVECFFVLMKVIRRAVINITPAAGKTKLGVAYGKWLLETGQVDFIVLVGPTAEICDSWSKAALRPIYAAPETPARSFYVPCVQLHPISR